MSNTLHEVRYGLVVAKIRRSRRPSKSKLSVSLHRLYRDGDTWTESARFRPQDIPAMRFVLDEAHEWIMKQTFDAG